MTKKIFTITALALLAFASVATAATTRGSIRGVVTDDTGAPLPGVTVSVDSDEVLGGPWVDVTDAEGLYSLANLPPGSYSVYFELEGFAPQERQQVAVRIDRTTEINAELSQAEVSETIVVTTETPIIDPEQTGTERMFSTEYLEKASIGAGGRSYQSVLQQAAGTTGGSNPSVYGSNLGENAWLIDGVSTTDPVTATFGTNFNFDAIQEVAFLTGGFDAEYGTATGGVVNVVTKSGGNDFSGTVDVRYRTDDFFESGDHFDPDLQDTKFLNPGATLGGPIVQDEAWFFTAYEYTDSDTTPVGSPTTRNFEGNYFLGKASWQLTDSWLGVFKYSTDPADIANANASQFRPPETTRKQEQGGDIFQLNLDAVLTPDIYWDLRLGVNRQELNSFPNDGDLETVHHLNDATGFHSGNYSNAQFSDRDRDEIRSTLTYYVDDLLGSHELKGGVEYSDLYFRSENFTTGGGYDYLDRNGPRILFFAPNPGPSEFDGELIGGFLQDSWRISPRVTAKLGVRYDQVAFDNDVGEEVADMDKIQPRLGIAWDVFGDARTVARLHAGRFMHPNALTLPSFARVNNAPTFRYISCSRFAASIFGVPPEACEAAFGGGSFTFLGFTADTWVADPDNTDPNGFLLFDVFGSAPNQIDPDLDAMYNDQIILSLEHQVAPQTSVEVSYVNKDTEDLIEDTCNGNIPTPSADAACDFYVMTNLDALRQEYEGYILRVESRAWDRLYAVGSYTYADSKASVGYTQNAGSDFDVFPVHFVNRFGQNQIEHDVELNGYLDLPWELTLAFDGDWTSGGVWTPVEDADPYGVEFLEPRGSREIEDFYSLDLQLTKALVFGGDYNVQLIATAFNVFSSEHVTNVCTDASGCGSAGDLGDPLEWQDPRRYEVGFRFEF